MRIKKLAPRAFSLTLSFALIQTTIAPEVWAQVVPVAVSAPVGGAAEAGASIGSANALVSGGGARILMPGASLTASPTAALPSAFAPAMLPVPSLPAPAIGAMTPAASARFVSPAAAPAAAAVEQFRAPALTASAAASTPEKGDSAAARPSADAPADAPSATPNAAAATPTGPRAAGVRALVSRRFAELAKFFSGRKDAGALPASFEAPAVSGAERNDAPRGNGLAPAAVGASDKVAQSGGDNAPPAPAAQTAKEKKSKAAWLGLGVAGASIIAYGLTMQVGLEAQGVAMPQLTENAFKDFTLLPLVTVFASIGSMVGQPMSKFFTERFGLAKTFYAAHAMRALSLGAMVVLFGFGHMSIPLMMGFYLLNGVVTGVAGTAEGTLKKLILAEKGVSMQSFRTWWQLTAETLAVPAPIFFGALVHTLGAVGAPMVTALYPVTILLGLILAYILRVYPIKAVKKASDQAAQTQAQAKEAAAQDAAAAAPAAPAKKAGVWNSIKTAATTIFKNMEEGKNYVMSIPYLKFSLMAGVAFDLFNIMIYRLISPGYGKMTGGAAGLSAVQGNMVGMFSLGGLLLAITFIVMENVSKKRAAKNAPTPASAAAAERTSLLRWTMAAIPATALLGLMAFHIALPLAPLIFLGTNWMPASVLAAALVPFGFFQVAASIKANSYFQEKLPQDAGKVQKALAFAGSVMTALSILVMLGLRPLFSAVNVFNPFPYMAAALIPIAVGLFFLWRHLKNATTPEAMAAADAAQRQRDAGEAPAAKAGGAYVGLILGIVAAAVVITALPMIPAAAGMMAGLNVLGRFALNLGLTLVIPALGAWIGRARGRKKDRAASAS